MLEPLVTTTTSCSLSILVKRACGAGVAAACVVAILLPGMGAAQTATPTPHCASQMGVGARLQLPACGVPTVSATRTPLSCNQLDGHLHPSDFHSNMRIQINPGPGGCPMHTLPIAQSGPTISNIIIEGGDDTPVNIEAADGSQNGFEIYNVTNIILRNLRFSGFKQPIVIGANAQNVTLDNVVIDDATDAGITIGGQNVCVRGVSVRNSAKGYRVTDTALGTVDFRGATAMSNAGDGFSIDHSGTGPSHVQFLSCSATSNAGDGYDVYGPQVEVLCSEARANGSKGVEAIGPSGTSTLQVENCEIKDNTAEGIHVGEAGQQLNGNIISNTLDHNGGSAIKNGAVLNVYDTISTNDVFVANPGTVHCGANLFRVNNACSNSTPPSVKATPHWLDSSHTKLAPDSAGVNQGVFPGTLGIPVLVAQRQDAMGVSRLSKSGYDIGAYFARAANTVTPTGQPTRTRTNTRTPRSTPTRTPATPPITATPCNMPRAACTGDCGSDGMVSISDLVTGVNIALGRSPLSACPEFDMDCSNTVSVAELVQAVDLSLIGCPMMPGEITGAAQGASANIVIGSALGNPGMFVGFSVDILNGACEPGGANVDLVFPMSQLDWPDCTIDPDLAAQGLKLVTSALGPDGGYGTERLILSQADDNAPGMAGMLCPGVTVMDGAFANCTAQIPGGAPLGYFNWLDNGTSVLTDVFGIAFNTVLKPGMIVVNGTALPDAQFVSQSVPTSMTVGAQYTVSVTMQNTGGKVWTSDPLSPQYSLGDPDGGFGDTDVWGVALNRVPLQSGEAVTLGAQKTFTFTVTAPSTPGTYDFIWQVVHDSGTSTSWIGQTSPVVSVNVHCGPCGCG